jgi:hypothetical protein
MKLFALNINTTGSCDTCVTRKADFVNRDGARTRYLNLLYLIRGRLFKPFVCNSIIEYNVPNTFAARRFFFFTGNSSKGHQGNGKDYVFHVVFLKWLIAIKIVAIDISRAFTRNALDRSCGFTLTAILKPLNLIRSGRIVIPFMNNNAIVNSLIPTVLSFSLFTKEGHNGYQCNDNCNFFHCNILIAINIISTAICNCSLARNASFFYRYSTSTSVLNFLNFIIGRLCYHPGINRGAAFYGFIITVLTFFLFTSNSG